MKHAVFANVLQIKRDQSYSIATIINSLVNSSEHPDKDKRYFVYITYKERTSAILYTLYVGSQTYG
jgi:hypothetical protein